METIRTSGDALLTIINDILDFSKIESGKLDLERCPFELQNCIEESLELLAPRASEKGLELAYFIDSSVPKNILGDVTRLRQILVNLLGNAVKFTESGEIVVCCTARQIEQVAAKSSPETINILDPQRLAINQGQLARSRQYEIQFAVHDTGIGIPPDRIDRLFKAFSQVDASTTRHYGGTGLGLAISQRLSDMMGVECGLSARFLREVLSLKLQFLRANQVSLEGRGQNLLRRRYRVRVRFFILR